MLPLQFNSSLRVGVLIAWLVIPSLSSHAQTGKKTFAFPKGVTGADYVSAFVNVKLKQPHRELFRGATGKSSGQLMALNGFKGVRELVPTREVLAAKSRKGPRRYASTVDTGLYYRVHCTPGTSIETFINELYATGYFEIVEPEYVNKMFYTPNDPQLVNQYYIDNIRAKEAWDIVQGDPSLMIAIVDSGGDLTHDDLKDNLFTNVLDPIDGNDNDGNQYIDDYQGWDFIGSDLSNLNDPDFLGDNSPQLTQGGLLGHGVNTAGCAGATADNGIGIAGVGFNTKIMWTKHSADNQPSTNGSIYLGYDGVYYAAIAGADVINCSWGGPNRSQISQDMINFITNDLGVVVVAAAGNDGTETRFYPAAYDNVISVSAVTNTNARASFSNFGSWIDVAAPGTNIYTTAFGNVYLSTQGTSFSSPIVAGAAALVRAHFPSYTPQQVAEQIRISANAHDLYTNNPSFIGKMGFGVLDVAAALTTVSPAIRASNPKLLNENGSPAQQGQKGLLTVTLTNVLAATTSALEVTVTENSAFLTVLKGVIRPGAIPAGGTVDNTLAPFEIQIANFVPDNFEVPLTLTFTDGTYVDQQEVTFILNPTYIDVDENLVTTTVSNTCRIGYEDSESTTRTKGSGFVFGGNSLLYEMGIIMGTGTGAQLYNNVRASSGAFDQDFVAIGDRIAEINPGIRSSSEISGSASNSSTASAQAFRLSYRSLAWKEAPYDKFVIMEYTISNPTATAIAGLHFGLFADWDVTENGSADAANWDVDNQMGYVFPFSAAGLPHAGIQVLTGSASYYAIDNDASLAGNTFGLYDGFTDAEKWTTLTSGTNTKIQAGTAYSGSDVSHVVSAGPLSIPPGQQVTLAFAIHAANSLTELQTSARYADTVYNYTLNAPKPVVADADACYGTSTMLTATGASSFNWYKDFTGGAPVFSGATFTTPNITNDTTFYVSNADNTYESVRTPAYVHVRANPNVQTSGSTIICSNDALILSAQVADSYLWSNGETTQAISVSAAGDYSVTLTNLSPACQNTSTPVTVTTIAAPVAGFSASSTLKTLTPIQFTDQSTGAITWSWDFDNGNTSTLQNPSTTYTMAVAANVKLIISSADGCSDTVTQTLDVITGLPHDQERDLRVYPNPTRSVVHLDVLDRFPGPRTIELLTVQGQVLVRREEGPSDYIDLSLADHPDGIYIIRISSGDRVLSRKVVKIH